MIKDIQLADCFQAGGVKLERVKYFQRQLLTVDDMVTDQDYFRQKMRRHNRFLHGFGVVCGLAVTAAPIAGAPLRVRIGEGYALGPFGDEIYVAEPVFLDLAKCGPNDKTDPCNPNRATGTGVTGGTVYVAIEYAECYSQPVRSMGAGCGCEDDGCEYSRIRDSFDLTCLASLPVYEPVPLICSLQRLNRTAPCPPCPSSPWIVLAAVTLPLTGAGDLAIDPSVRRPLYRTELLQQQLIACCCDKGTTPTPAVPVQVVATGLNPANGATITLNANAPLMAFTVPFTKALVATSVQTGIVVLFNGTALPVNLAYTDTNHTVTITPKVATRPFLAGAYKITVSGTGATPITDTDGLPLDGSFNGKNGDYSYGFTLQNATGGTIPGVTNPLTLLPG